MLHDRHHIVLWNVILKFVFKLYVSLITFVNNDKILADFVIATCDDMSFTACVGELFTLIIYMILQCSFTHHRLHEINLQMKSETIA